MKMERDGSVGELTWGGCVRACWVKWLGYGRAARWSRGAWIFFDNTFRSVCALHDVTALVYAAYHRCPRDMNACFSAERQYLYAAYSIVLNNCREKTEVFRQIPRNLHSNDTYALHDHTFRTSVFALTRPADLTLCALLWRHCLCAYVLFEEMR